RYPFLMVSGSESGKFDVTAGIGPPLPIAEFDTVTGDQQMRQALFRATEYEQMLSLDITATDSMERAFLSLLCSEALSPAPPIEGPWMYGCRLYLPHYYGEVATYEPIGYGYTENADMAMRRERQSVLMVKAKVPMLTLATYPVATPVVRTVASTLPIPTIPESASFGWAN